MALSLAYGSNGFSNHRLTDCLEILAELGYDGVAITLDVHHLDPATSTRAAISATALRLRELALRCTVETGARFVLDRWRKHWPTLVSAEAGGRALRRSYILRALDLGAQLGAECVSLWSGVKDPGLAEASAWDFLVDELHGLLDAAEALGVTLCFEPEPGMFIDGMARFAELSTRLDDTRLRLTLDVGHVACTESTTVAEAVTAWQSRLANVHIEDIRGRVHEHLPFGEGDLAFRAILRALLDASYTGLVAVELARDSHRAPELAKKSIDFLRRCESEARANP